MLLDSTALESASHPLLPINIPQRRPVAPHDREPKTACRPASQRRPSILFGASSRSWSFRGWVRGVLSPYDTVVAQAVDPVAARQNRYVHSTEDYLTVRHANPRTGRISPHVFSSRENSTCDLTDHRAEHKNCCTSFETVDIATNDMVGRHLTPGSPAEALERQFSFSVPRLRNNNKKCTGDHDQKAPSMTSPLQSSPSAPDSSDRFAIVTPTLEDPTPGAIRSLVPSGRLPRGKPELTYNESPTVAQIAALRHYHDKSRHFLRHDYTTATTGQHLNPTCIPPAHVASISPAQSEPAELAASPPTARPSQDHTERLHFHTGPLVHTRSIPRKPVGSTAPRAASQSHLRGRGTRVTELGSPAPLQQAATGPDTSKRDAILAASLAHTPETAVRRTATTLRSVSRLRPVPPFPLPPSQVRCAGTFTPDHGCGARAPDTTAGQLAPRRFRARGLMAEVPAKETVWVQIDLRMLGRLLLAGWVVVFALLALNGVGNAAWVALAPVRAVLKVLKVVLGY